MARIMDDLTQSGKENEIGIERVIKSVERIFNELPPAYKRWALFQDVLLVLGGIKSMTDYSFLGDTWNEEEFQKFKELFAAEGIIVTEPEIQVGKNWERRTGSIYNPETLAVQTKDNKFAPPFKMEESLDKYINRAQSEEYPIAGIYGTLYSFPQSAIEDFLNAQSDQAVRETNHFGGETYWFTPPAKPDVIEREQNKRDYFAKLAQSDTIQKLRSSAELAKSDEIWVNRLPKSLQRN